MALTDSPSAARLRLLTRNGCELCEEMLAELQILGRDLPLPPLELADIDADPELQRRFGLLVPVLMLDGSAICHGHLDAQELRRLLRPR